ncbi:MAG TPA: hypothetical protein VI168_14425 [Croceibacterium sp.]
MRAILPLVALVLATGAAAEQEVALAPAPEIPVLPDPSVRSPGLPLSEQKVCIDRIHEVRAERGFPLLDRGNAVADEPLMIAAVDHRIDGCSVLVMRHDTRDVRPLPTRERPLQLERLPGR